MKTHRLLSELLLSSLLLAGACVDPTDSGPQVELSQDEAPADTTVIFAGVGPDLVETAVSDPPASAVIGSSFSATDTVANQGTADAGASLTRYYLTLNGTSPVYSLGSRSVGALTVGASDSGGATLNIPSAGGGPAMSEGSYRLLVCADRGSQITEGSEENNCIASAGSVALTGPDLAESGVTVLNSPATVIAQTGTLQISDTVTNVGSAPAAASVTRFWLSTDAVKSANDAFIRNCTNGGLIPGRNIGSLNGGATSTGTTTTSPLCVRDAAGLHPPATGTYSVIACADTTNLVGELREEDFNCAASTNTITVVGYVDLIESAVSFTPGSVAAGDTLTITDTVKNVGGDTSGASHTKFYLQRNGTGGLNTYLGTSATATLPRAVGALTANATNTASTALTIPDNLQNGNYSVYACADAGPANSSARTSEVVEADENNNCTAAAGLLLASADLIISAISNPPATGSTSGPSSHFVVTATTSNIGTATAKASVNKFYLSADGVVADYFLGVRQDVPSLAPNATATASTPGTGNVNQQITIPTGTAPGTYWLLGCADGGNNNNGNVGDKVREANEDNNCLKSATQITVN